MLGEDLRLDPGLGVVADPARLAWEDDRRVPVDRQDDVRVAMKDPKAREVADGTLEAGVLGARDDHGVEAVGGGSLANVGVAALDVGRGRHGRGHSRPFTSAVSERFRGASTPWRSPYATIAPFRKSISVRRPASTSWSMLGLWS